MSGWVAGAIVVGGVIGAVGSNMAANKQAASARNAQNLQQGMFDTTLQNEAPFLQQGTGAVNKLGDLMGTSGNTGASGYGSLNKPFTGDMMKQYSPGYQFQLQQGQQNTLNQNSAARGAESGAALKDLTSFNQSYANTAFNSAFNQYQTQQNNVFGRLNSLATLGQGAASNQATGASSFSQGIGNSAQNVGAAQAGGIVGGTNSLSSGLSNGAIWAAYGGGGSGGSPGYATNGGYVYNGVSQNGGQGGGIGNIVDAVP